MNLSTQLGSEFYEQESLQELLQESRALEKFASELIRKIAFCFSPILQDQESYSEFESLVETKYGFELRQSVQENLSIDQVCGLSGGFAALYSTILAVCDDMIREIDLNNLNELYSSRDYISPEETYELEQNSLMFSFILPANYKEDFQNLLRFDEADEEAEQNRLSLQEYLNELQRQRSVNQKKFL